MENQPTTEELLNKIKLLETALTFYADETNYGTEGQKKVELKVWIDHGHQARFALNQLKEINKFNNDLIDEYKKLIDQHDLKSDDFYSNMKDIMKIQSTLNKDNNEL